jgi:signal transduction histidine kinase
MTAPSSTPPAASHQASPHQASRHEPSRHRASPKGDSPHGAGPLTASPPPPALASLLCTSLARGRLEITAFFRDREAVIFTFSLPVILLVVFGEVFHGTIGTTGEPGALDAALRRLAATADGHPGAAARFEVRGTAVPLPRPAEVMLLRVAQEALANARKHARAGQVIVCLRYAEGQVSLDVTDDGSGFDPGQAAGGYGLPGMRARAEEAGGRLQVRSSPGCGTTVSVAVPVPVPAGPAGPGEPGQAGAA